MSSSPSAAGTAAALESRPRPNLEPFPYDAVSPGAAARAAGRSTAGWAQGGGFGNAVDAGGDPVVAREAQARLQGQQEGQTAARQAFDEQLARERNGLSAALSQFTRDRATYFQKVEGEVVQLALGIARKILHREAQIDPLLLAGIVRVALEQIDGATGVRLRVHPQNAADWRRYLSLHLEPSDLPEVIEDPSQAPDQCILETAMGTAAVGLEIQLKEIEHGLMDLLAARPGAAS